MSTDTDFSFDDVNDTSSVNNDADDELSGMGEDDGDFNIYGGLNGSDIIDGVPDGFYDMEIVSIKRAHNIDKDTHNIVFTWEVYDNDSDFAGQQVLQYFNVFPKLAQDIAEGRLNNREKGEIFKKIGRLKKNLARIGMTPTEIENGKWSEMQKMVGNRRRLEIQTKDDFVNVRNIAEVPGHTDAVSDDGFNIDLA